MFADIIVDIKHEKLDKVFQYRIPKEMEEDIRLGMEVVIPFGMGNRRTKGYIVGLSKTCNYDVSKIKEILEISHERVEIEAKLISLAAWMKEHYGGTMIQALKTVLPVKQKEQAKVKRYVRLLLDKESAKKQLDYYLEKNQKARARLLAALLDTPVISYELVTKKLNISLNVVRALEEQKIAILESEQVYRNPVTAQGKQEYQVEYTEEQSIAIETFWKAYKNGIYQTYLLHGVTGSGKTEVYIEMIRRVVSQGKQAIVLIPEISLTYQTVMRFYRCFGERISIMNSRLSAGERYDQMMRAKNGEIDVMIGPRSALFTPFPKLGLIVIDEEHEMTYKSEQIPRYHARETAQARAKMEGASVVLGSATPSMEAMYRAKKGEYQLLSLKNRSGMQSMAQVYTIDLRQELKEGNRSILSYKLQELIAQRLERKEQVILFLNRRGYAGFISCRECGHVIKCPHCDVSLSYHKNGKLMCHYCGYEEKRTHNCPACGSRHIGEFRAGTEQIEEIVKKQFPKARVLRMDLDTTREKNGHEKILSAFANEEADILVGTQMIVKGHDFPNVTLVGVLAADMSLYSNDYRSGERTFQLLTQAVGRAGRGEKSGEAIIQTYSPEHYAVVSAAAQDYEAFYTEEIQYRALMGYPPVEHLLAVFISCEEELLLEKGSKYLKEFALRIASKETTQIIGPANPGIGKLNDIYRKVIYIKDENYDTLIKIKNTLEQYIEINSGYKKMRIYFDFNPMNVF